MTETGREGTPRSATIWDVPVRLVHWSFVLLMPALWWTWKSGQMNVHRVLGYVMLALVLFRLAWGFWGSSTARFGNFVRGPATVAGYLRRRAPDTAPKVGHNPLGGWSVMAMLALLAVQVSLGLIATDVDGVVSGPLSYKVSYDVANTAREWHGYVFNVLLGFVGLHVAAIAGYHLIARKNLVGPMLLGKGPLPAGAAGPVIAPAWRGLLVLAVVATIAWWIASGAPLG